MKLSPEGRPESPDPTFLPWRSKSRLIKALSARTAIKHVRAMDHSRGKRLQISATPTAQASSARLALRYLRRNPHICMGA